MWIMLNDAFFSIVSKDCAPDELMVRARRPGDIEKVFPEMAGKVKEFTSSDYHYRAAIKCSRVAFVIMERIIRIDYSNFKNTVRDKPLHDAYLRVWNAMADLQPQAPYAGRRQASLMAFDVPDVPGFRGESDFDDEGNIVTPAPKAAKKKPAKKNTRGR